MKILVLLLVGLAFFSGCVLGDNSKALAHDLATLRNASVPDGLLVPVQPASREKYRNDLLAFRAKVSSGDAALNAYLSGSVALVDLQNETDAGVAALKTVDPNLVECAPHTSGGNAIAHLQAALAEAQTAQKMFQIVQGNAGIAHALGAEYMTSVNKTLSAILSAHAQRVNQIKIACGQLPA